ncbi:hypothetical protein [Amycolatopsis sp. PS_44_ISF1]|uniref:hypothetical protein n=1 Tax=Amycolatopsis sp. PS_44_ISF1 TaxID=2974917 RepID=UPI0028DE92C6|nr:hypothetical protein [Amycolatopsis sp. PS_44_ISF1]MDT8914240.1 hypothetical protein [Amycolatopsis sp. PS_44_ISF1]
MDAIVFNLTTALLLILIAASGLTLLGRDTVPNRRMPWLAVALTGLAVAGVVLQLCWPGAGDALDSDPSRAGWWRVLTAVFLQNGGVAGAAWNLATLAVIAALAEWFWGRPLALLLFLAGILLPHHIDALLGLAAGPVDPRNFAGSSGATYFLGATLAAPLLIRTRVPKQRLTAIAVVALGLAMWFVQDNGHGLVSVYGFVLGALTWAVGHRWLHPDRDLVHPAGLRVGVLPGFARKG